MSSSEESHIGELTYGDLECPFSFIVKEDDKVFKISLLSETFSAVKVRKHFSNADKNDRLYIEYYKDKTDKIYILDDIDEDQVIIFDLKEFEDDEEI